MTVLRDCQPVLAAQDVAAMAYWHVAGKYKDDVFLCSYPKSGRTWLRFLLTYYQIRLLGIDYELTLKTLPTLSPNITLFSPVRMRALPVEAPIRRILGTHSELPRLFRGHPVIMLRRDVRDVLVSYYYQRAALGEFFGDIESFLESPWGIRRAVRYYNRWYSALPGFPRGTVLELTYERLHSETSCVVGECLQFMGIDLRESLISETVAFASAENMRKIEARWGRPDYSVEQLQLNRDGFRVRKARVGGFKDELAPETAKRLGEILRTQLVNSFDYDY